MESCFCVTTFHVARIFILTRSQQRWKLILHQRLRSVLVVAGTPPPTTRCVSLSLVLELRPCRRSKTNRLISLIIQDYIKERLREKYWCETQNRELSVTDGRMDHSLVIVQQFLVWHVMEGWRAVTDMSDSHCIPEHKVPGLEIIKSQLWTLSHPTRLVP